MLPIPPFRGTISTTIESLLKMLMERFQGHFGSRDPKTLGDLAFSWGSIIPKVQLMGS